MSESKRYGWSIGGEVYRGDCDSREDAIADAIMDDDLTEGAKVWTAERHEPDLADYLNVERLLEDMQERAYDEAGECVDGNWPELSVEEQGQLHALIVGFLKDHGLAPQWWIAVDPVEHVVTRDDITRSTLPEPPKEEK